MPDDERTKIIIYDTGKVYWCYVDELWPKDEEIRRKNTSYNEEKDSDNRSV